MPLPRDLDDTLADLATGGGTILYLRQPNRETLLHHREPMLADHSAAAAILADLALTRIQIRPGAGVHPTSLATVGVSTGEGWPVYVAVSSISARSCSAATPCQRRTARRRVRTSEKPT